MKIKTLFLAGLSAISVTGCASIFDGGSTQRVSIASDPPGANVKVVNSQTESVVTEGVTPMSVDLSRSDGYFDSANYTVVLSQAGYQDKFTKINSDVTGWYFGNILFGGLIGLLIVDPMTGAMYDLNPKSITEFLQPL